MGKDLTKDTTVPDGSPKPKNASTKNGEETSYELPPKPLFGRGTMWAACCATAVYLGGGLLGTIVWSTCQEPQLRLLAAGLIFPGSGYLALSRWYTVAFIGNMILIPVSIFGWFWGGAAIFPLGVYYGAAVASAYLGRYRNPSSFLEYTPHVAWTINALLVWKWYSSIRNAVKEQEALRVKRNSYVPAQVEELNAAEAKALEAHCIGSEELTREQLRYLRYPINLTRQPMHSWEGFTMVDQFREGALRYQLYYIIYTLATVQNRFMPNFHGYMSEAQRVAIEKVLRPESLYYWAFERTWGRFSLDWDPVKNENIMLTGWYLAAIMMYTSTTRDMRYMEPGSLVCQVTPFHKYPHSIPSMVEALMTNWNNSPYTLYACEPNWVFPMCNAYGAIGVQIYDRLIGTANWEKISARFKKAWLDEFTLPSGETTVFRSTFTGLSVSAQGTIDNSLALFTQSFFPEEAKKYCARFRKEYVKADENGKVTSIREEPLDHFDAGCYKMLKKNIVGKIWTLAAARERADTELADFVERAMDENVDLLDDGKGGVFPDEMSTMSAVTYTLSKLSGFNRMRDVVEKGPPESTFRGPLLAEVPYPQVLVAKAWSAGKDLDIVLYDGEGEITTTLRLERLQPGKQYVYNEHSLFADVEGKAMLEVTVCGKTAVYLQPVD